jgi:hypothetical protein
MSSYYELLKDPRWQKKRLDKLNAANFECEDCGSGEKTLHIHHSYYESKKMPWEYPDDSLHVLCEDCHSKAGARNTALKRMLGQIDLYDEDDLRGYCLAIFGIKNENAQFRVDGYEVAQGIADWWGLTPEIIIDNLQDGQTCGRALLELVAIHGSPRKPWLVRIAGRKADA